MVTQNAGATRLTVAKAYDYLDRLTSITNTPSASPAVSYAYTYDQANQRTQVVREDGTYWSYGYNAKGEVIQGQKKLATGDLLNGYDYAYDYDDIGNRKSTTTNGQAAAYTPNLLNQYTQRAVPGVVDVFGTADPAAIVTVNYAATTRQGAYFYAQPTVDNASLPKYSTLTVYGVKHNVGPNGEDAVSNTTRNAFTAKTPEPFTYDDDGNLTSDGHWTYAWDAENRLIGMQSQPAAAAAGALNLLLEFAYDATGRRIQKTVSAWNGSAFTPTSDTRFLYDGWNLQAEFAGTADTATSSYVWGLDLSGTLQGAGGVGGLIHTYLPNGAYAPSYDANGNIIDLVNPTDGT